VLEFRRLANRGNVPRSLKGWDQDATRFIYVNRVGIAAQNGSAGIIQTFRRYARPDPLPMLNDRGTD
jgi:hypothetical protein